MVISVPIILFLCPWVKSAGAIPSSVLPLVKKGWNQSQLGTIPSYPMDSCLFCVVFCVSFHLFVWFALLFSSFVPISLNSNYPWLFLQGSKIIPCAYFPGAWILYSLTFALLSPCTYVPCAGYLYFPMYS